jgi:integrase/recombinase XerD
MTMEPTALEKVEARQPLDLSKNPPEDKAIPVPGSKQPVMEKYLQQLGRFGQPHVQEYLYDLKRRNCRPNTLRSYVTAWKSFFSHLQERGRTSLEAVTRDDLSSFIEHEQDRGMQPNTVHTRIRLLYALFKFLVDREVVAPNLVSKKLRIKVPEALPRALEPEDVRQLLAVITHERDRALILVLLRTGMRIGELLDTRMGEVNLREKCIAIREAQKNRVGRVVYLSEDACQALQVWLEKRRPEQGYLFYGQGRQRLSYTAARVRLGKHLARAGLAYKGYSLHCLRHTCATDLLNAGMRLECVQQILGHSSIEMTRRYARLTDNTRREEYFRAMARIEKGEAYGHHQRHLELPPVLEEKELLRPYH